MHDHFAEDTWFKFITRIQHIQACTMMNSLVALIPFANTLNVDPDYFFFTAAAILCLISLTDAVLPFAGCSTGMAGKEVQPALFKGLVLAGSPCKPLAFDQLLLEGELCDLRAWLLACEDEELRLPWLAGG